MIFFNLSTLYERSSNLPPTPLVYQVPHPMFTWLSYLVSVINVAKTTSGASSPENNVTRSLLYILTKPVLMTGACRVRWKRTLSHSSWHASEVTLQGDQATPLLLHQLKLKPFCYRYQKIKGPCSVITQRLTQKAYIFRD